MDKSNNKWDVAAVLLELFAIFGGRQSQMNRSATNSGGQDEKQKTVSILHAFLSKVDEGMWAAFIGPLSPPQKLALTHVEKLLTRFHEKESFRYTVVNMPVATILTEVSDPSDKKKMIKKVIKGPEYGGEDNRVIFLKEIADLVDDPKWGDKKVRDMLRTHQLATENKIAKHALQFWKKSTKWAEKNILELFGVNSFEEITLHHVAVQINLLALEVPYPYRRGAQVNQGFWWGNFRHHPVQTFGLAIGIIVVSVWFIASVIANN
jgi:hypothetical protein